jgi:hypothetical protein
MTTTTPILKTHPHSRRFVTIALAFGAGAALGVAGTALTTSDHTLTRAPAPQAQALWTGDVKDHPRYNPPERAGRPDQAITDVKDHPLYHTSAVWTGDVKDHPLYHTSAVWTGDVKDHPLYHPT